MSAAAIRLHLNRCHYPVRGLGYGKRVGIWFQGCSIHCPGCIVPETWNASAQYEVALLPLLRALLPWLEDCEGVTISGGEPFDQPQALLALLVSIRELIKGDILVYSGYSYRRLLKKHADLLGKADALISGPFVASRRHPDPTLIGSTNQRLHLFTALARARYANWTAFPRAIGIAAADDGLELAGLLRPNDLTQLATSLTGAGWKATLTHVEV